MAPSSRALAEATRSRIDPREPQIILELGAGTGVVTRVAADRMPPETRLIAVEQDPNFARALGHAVPGAEVVVDDACNLSAILRARGVRHLDAVLNGLPTPSLTPPQRRRIEEALGAVDGRPWVSQITVMPWVYQGFYRRRYDRVEFQPVFRNMPPGGVYHCRGVRV